MSARENWDSYFMRIAVEVATRATCDRRHVGAVVVRDRQMLSSGYNGAPRGLPHCDEEGHEMADGHCVRAVHAEANAIAQAARNGVKIDGATVYITDSPCYGCFKLLVNAGIVRIVFGTHYPDPRGLAAAEKLGIEVVPLPAEVTR